MKREKAATWRVSKISEVVADRFTNKTLVAVFGAE